MAAETLPGAACQPPRTPDPEDRSSVVFFQMRSQTSSRAFLTSQQRRRLDPKACVCATLPHVSPLLDLKVRVPWPLAAASWCHRGRLLGDASLHGVQGAARCWERQL